MAPRYLPAVSGYHQLEEDSPLRRHDEGFAALLELVAANAPQTTKARAVVLRLAGLDFGPGGNGIHIESFDADNRKIHGASILDPKTTLKQRFFERNVEWARRIIVVLSVVATAIAYLMEFFEKRRGDAQAVRLDF